jgi:hypothetical protein
MPKEPALLEVSEYFPILRHLEKWEWQYGKVGMSHHKPWTLGMMVHIDEKTSIDFPVLSFGSEATGGAFTLRLDRRPERSPEERVSCSETEWDWLDSRRAAAYGVI